MARSSGQQRNVEDILWQGLVVVPGFVGCWLGFKFSHSLLGAGVGITIGAGLGIGILISRRIAQEEKLKRSGIRDVDRMSGRQFERFLGHLFHSMGYQVTVTQESGDYGADLVIERSGSRIVVQAKRYKGNVGIKAVQEVQASIAHYKANKGWVVTNSVYTEAAINLAKSNGIRLVGRNELVEMILNKTEKPQEPRPSSRGGIQATQRRNGFPPNEIICEKCGNKMPLKRTSLGLAYICKSYPTCKNIKQVP